MLIDERKVTLTEAARHLPPLNGKRVHASAIWRWITKGVRGVRLEGLLLGGRYVTSLEALERFGKALAGTSRAPAAPAPRPRTSRQREHAIRRARQKLEAAGI